MQTTTSADISAAVKKTLTSRAFERFISLAVDNALAEASRADGALQLLTHQGKVVEFDDHNSAYYLHTPGKGYAVTLYRGRPDASDKNPKRDGVWWGYEERLGTDGNLWQRRINAMVCNDFGNLVEVAV